MVSSLQPQHGDACSRGGVTTNFGKTAWKAWLCTRRQYESQHRKWLGLIVSSILTVKVCLGWNYLWSSSVTSLFTVFKYSQKASPGSVCDVWITPLCTHPLREKMSGALASVTLILGLVSLNREELGDCWQKLFGHREISIRRHRSDHLQYRWRRASYPESHMGMTNTVHLGPLLEAPCPISCPPHPLFLKYPGKEKQGFATPF